MRNFENDSTKFVCSNISFIVEKCSFNNGGCDSTALCRNPTEEGKDVTCYCGAGLQFASNGRVCTSIAEAKKHCPTSDCWTYEMDSESNTTKCVMKQRVYKKFLFLF